MDRRIILIHDSEIIQRGLHSLIDSLFECNTILLNSPSELKNYTRIKGTRLILLADSRLDQSIINAEVQKFDVSNSIKIVLVLDASEQSTCPEGCDCCLSLNDPKERIKQLLQPFFYTNNHPSEKNNSALLTERETDVLKLVAFGKTNKEIGDELYISIHTVISHRKNITEKLGIKSISGLTVYAILNNLIDTKKIDPNELI